MKFDSDNSESHIENQEIKPKILDDKKNSRFNIELIK